MGDKGNERLVTDVTLIAVFEHGPLNIAIDTKGRQWYRFEGEDDWKRGGKLEPLFIQVDP